MLYSCGTLKSNISFEIMVYQGFCFMVLRYKEKIILLNDTPTHLRLLLLHHKLNI